MPNPVSFYARGLRCQSSQSGALARCMSHGLDILDGLVSLDLAGIPVHLTTGVRRY